MRLVSLTKIKLFLEITGADHDSLLMQLADLISARIEQESGYKLEKIERTEDIVPDGLWVYLKAKPVDKTEPIVVMDNGAEIPTIDYLVDAERAQVNLKFREFTYLTWPSIQVTYTGGYAFILDPLDPDFVEDEQALAVPDILKRALLLQLRYEYKRRDDMGLAAISVGGASVSLAPVELLPDVKQLVSLWRGGSWFV